MKDPCTNHASAGRLWGVAGRKKASGLGGWRPGAGRKREIQDPVRITVDLEREDLAALDSAAARRGVRRIALIREAFRWVLRQRPRRRRRAR